MYIHGTCAIHVWPEELCGTAGRSAGSLHTHMQPRPLLSKLLDDEHNCHEEVPGKLEPFQQKENVVLADSPQPQQPRRCCGDPHITSSSRPQLLDQLHFSS